MFGPDIIKEAEEQVQLIRSRLKAAQSRQKGYVDSRWRPLTFQVGDFVYLRVTPLKDMQRFHEKGKLAPRYVGPYKILERHGQMSCKLELPPKLSEFHNVFHVSQLRKCLQAPNKPATLKEIDQDSIDLNHDLTYHERPIHILEKMSVSLVDEKSICTRSIGVTIPKMRPLGNVKIISSENFPSCSTLSYRISGRDSFKGGRSVTPHFL
jgi:hypothetical protein